MQPGDVPSDGKTLQYSGVTELGGNAVSDAQLRRILQRYTWAAYLSSGKDVLEIACGSGLGLGLLAKAARNVFAADIDGEILAHCRRHYSTRVLLLQLDAQSLPFADRSLDTVIMFEAIYYLRNIDLFLAECHRVLRPGGSVLLSLPNSELFDFNRSPHSFFYPNLSALRGLLQAHGFDSRIFGSDPCKAGLSLELATRILKAIAVRYSLIPGSMTGKRLLRRMFHGALRPLPAEIQGTEIGFAELEPIGVGNPVKEYRVLYAHGCRMDGQEDVG